MAVTYTLISSNVLSSNTSSVTFSSIPSTYTDLVLKISGRNTGTAEWTGDLRLRFNSDSATNYSDISLNATPTVSGASDNPLSFFYGNYAVTGEQSPTSTFGSTEFYIPSYSNTSINKQLIMSGAVQNTVSLPFRSQTAGLWRNTAAISTILIYSSGTFTTNSSFYLYGIKNS